jgi:diguanylate cyclase (GGDEF)-like protein
MQDYQKAQLVAEKMRTALNYPFALAGQQLTISSSMGIAIYPEHGADETQLLRNADMAMYKAKQDGHYRVVIYSE